MTTARRRDQEPPADFDATSDILDFDRDEFRRLGYWVVDRTAEHLATLDRRPAVSVTDLSRLEELLGGELPMDPGVVETGLALLADVAFEHQQHGDHPRYFARVPGPSSHAGILADWLSTGMQAISSSWAGGSGPATLELVALGWLQEALGMPAASEGVLLSGGSMANVTALVAARHANGDGVIYLSDQTHSSVRRGITSIGHPPELVRVVPTDHAFRLSPRALHEVIESDHEAGRSPSIVVATAGTTNTGAVDDLPAISAICREYGAWLHVDGAYGAPAALVEGRSGILGLELADSLVLDPHKWLFQPYDVACLLVARPGVLEAAFGMHPEYLADAQGGPVDFHNRGLELTRRSRAAKLWLTLRTYGMRRLACAVERGILLAELAQRAVELDPRLEVVTPAQLGVLTFKGIDATAADVVRACEHVTSSGFAAVSSTVLKGRTVVRMCTINPRTSRRDVEQTVERLAESIARQPGGER